MVGVEIEGVVNNYGAVEIEGVVNNYGGVEIEGVVNNYGGGGNRWSCQLLWWGWK